MQWVDCTAHHVSEVCGWDAAHPMSLGCCACYLHLGDCRPHCLHHQGAGAASNPLYPPVWAPSSWPPPVSVVDLLVPHLYIPPPLHDCSSLPSCLQPDLAPCVVYWHLSRAPVDGFLYCSISLLNMFYIPLCSYLSPVSSLGLT